MIMGKFGAGQGHADWGKTWTSHEIGWGQEEKLREGGTGPHLNKVQWPTGKLRGSICSFCPSFKELSISALSGQGLGSSFLLFGPKEALVTASCLFRVCLVAKDVNQSV